MDKSVSPVPGLSRESGDSGGDVINDLVQGGHEGAVRVDDGDRLHGRDRSANGRLQRQPADDFNIYIKPLTEQSTQGLPGLDLRLGG